MIRDGGTDAFFLKCDVTNPKEVERLVAETVRRYGELDACCNNAGALKSSSVVNLDSDDWDQVLDVNLKGMWLCLKYEITQMLTHGTGAIVNIASVAGLRGRDGPAYVASKHGVVGLTRSAALQYASKGIRVNAVCPSYVPTEMTAGITNDPESMGRVLSRTPLGRAGTPEDTAEAVVWLCSDKASFITGHALVVDGGMTIA